jgi:3-methylfumaryl-CoA hydratase
MMFRYSALTFNGHRIHYDRDHSVNVEGHPGLVVHGPMQATWMLALATDHLGHLPTEMSYRGLAAYIEGTPATVAISSAEGEGVFDAMVVNNDGIKTMQATVLA